MTLLDVVAVGVVLLSVLFAYARGVIRSLIGTAAWIVGLVAAIAFAPAVGAWFPPVESAPLVPWLVAFVLIFVTAVVLGALVAWPLRTVVARAGMGFLDRALGATFGLLRGLAIMIAFALVAGVSGLAQRDWWQNAFLAPSLASGAFALRPWLPRAWVERLDFSPEGPAAGAPRPTKG